MTGARALIAAEAERVPMSAEEHPIEQRVLLRIGGVCAVLGAIVFAVSLAGHGDLPTHISSEVALRFVAGHENWLLMHLGTIVAGLLWIGAFAALSGTVSTGLAAALGRFLLPAAIMGGLFVVLDYAVDGYAFKVLADEWAAAAGTERANLLLRFETLLALGSGTFRAEMVLFYGVTFLIAGLAVAADGRYPRWFGGIGAVAGALATVAGLSAFLGLELRLDVLVFVVALPVEGLWMLALGVLMWRRAHAQHLVL